MASDFKTALLSAGVVSDEDVARVHRQQTIKKEKNRQWRENERRRKLKEEKERRLWREEQTPKVVAILAKKLERIWGKPKDRIDRLTQEAILKVRAGVVVEHLENLVFRKNTTFSKGLVEQLINDNLETVDGVAASQLD